jgi:hypothetical protein
MLTYVFGFSTRNQTMEANPPAEGSGTHLRMLFLSYHNLKHWELGANAPAGDLKVMRNVV